MAQTLIIGGGGREHAIADALTRSAAVDAVYMTAHNAATARFTQTAPSGDFEEITQFCRRQKIDLVVVGPEAYLADGISDHLQAAGICTLAPTRRAARLESSKIYAKTFMQQYGIPTTDFTVCDTMESVRAHLTKTAAPYVLKADGLAAGKGVEIHSTRESAETAAQAMLSGKYGEASRRLLLEEFAEGEEMSFIVLANGRHAVPLATCRDYKRLMDNDEGPNTGGMGVVSPAPLATRQRQDDIMRRVIQPALDGLYDEGAPFCGFLYAGLMLNGDDIKVLEFNCRLGDPETQVILPRLAGDWYPPLLAAAQGRHEDMVLQWRDGAAVGVVLAAAGYPDNPRKGDVIRLPDDISDGVIYHAGTRITENGDVVSDGGRVLTVVQTADTQEAARQAVYAHIQHIHFDGMQYRRDIGGIL